MPTMQMSLKAVALFAGVTQVEGGALTDHEKHNDWWYGANEAPCATVDDDKRCGPENWADVAGDEACKEQGTQSPIDIVTANAEAGADYKALVLTSAALTDAKANYEVNSHTTEVAFTDASTAGKMELTWGGEKFTLKQFHFHSPSENQMDGKYYPMEVHHVHQNAAGQAFVLSAMIKTGATENAYYKDVWAKIAGVTGNASAQKWEKEDAFTQSPYDAFKFAEGSYLYYKGSFTTPPCTTNTHWVVMKDPIEINDAQLQEYRTKIQSAPQSQLAACTEGRCGAVTPTGVQDNMAQGTTWNAAQGTNNRPIQGLGDRKITKWDAPASGGSTTQAAGGGGGGGGGASTTSGPESASGAYANGLGFLAFALLAARLFSS